MAKDKKKGKSKRRFKLTKERRMQLIAIFLVLLMIGSALVLITEAL